MSETPSWYSQGFEGIKKEEDRLATMWGVPRLWLKPGASADIVWLDDEPACIHEHNPNMNGSWRNWITCIKDFNPDNPVCCQVLGHDTRYYVGYFTVVDLTEWKDTKGNIHKNEIKLLGAKLKTLKLLQAKKEGKEGRLAGRLYRVMRTDKQSPSCGNDFEYTRDVDMSKLFGVAEYKGKRISDLFRPDKPEDLDRLKKTFKVKVSGDKIEQKLVPFDYYSVLQPKAPKDMEAMLRGAKIEKSSFDNEDGEKSGGGDKGGAAAAGSNKPDDDIPF